MRKHILKLLVLILSPLQPTQSNAHPFAMAAKSWTVGFVEELVNMLSQCLHGGIADAAHVIKFFLQEVEMFGMTLTNLAAIFHGARFLSNGYQYGSFVYYEYVFQFTG
jgi:hypothetical protein